MPPTAVTRETLIVTKDELSELAEWERKYADATKKATVAEKQLKFRRQALAEKVLGVNSADELKHLSPKEVGRRYQKRLDAGDWKLERNAPEFSFTEIHHGTYPAWKQLYIAEHGETAAAAVQARTPLTYSYAVEVSVS